MNKGLKNKGLGSWFCLAAALVALITGIVFLLTQATAAPLGHSGTMAGVVLLVGAAASLVFFFVSVPFSALIQAVIYNIALYLVVVQLYFVFADVINHVTFAGGNAGLCVFYMVGTFIACLLSVIACFCKQTKTGEAKATGKQFAAAGAVVVVAAVCVGGFSLQSSSLPSNGDAEVAPDAAQTSADGPVMNYNDNEFTSKTLDDLVAIPQETWEAKEPNGEVAYFFEGQYTEGFSTIVDPACLDMYCYTDGSMWGSFSGPSTSVGGDSISHVYGYWYNYDENGEKNFVIHLLGNQDADGTVRPTDVDGGADADIFVFDTDHGVYSMEASLSYGVMGGAFTRNINIYGQPYAPAKSLTIDASNLRTFYTGDIFNPGELVVTATRANGAEESIWGGRLTFTGYDSDTAGIKTVTASFLGATATFEVQVEDLVTEQYTGSYELVQGETPTATDAVLLVDYSHVYGYWYNYDENGEKNFVIHLLGNQDADGTVRPTDVDGGADADIFVFDTDHGVYSMEASLSYGVMGGAFTRNINIYGQPYAPAKSLTIDASNLRTFYTGDIFNPGELVVTATRANGAEESIWGGRLTFTGYDSDTAGIKTVTASFLGATATFEVQVEDLVTEQYTGSYELVQGETPTATDAVLLVDYSHKVCTLTAADGSASITGTLVDVQDDALTMTLNGSDALTVPITEGEDGSKQLTIPAHDEIVSGWGYSNTYSINEAVVTLAAE